MNNTANEAFPAGLATTVDRLAPLLIPPAKLACGEPFSIFCAGQSIWRKPTVLLGGGIGLLIICGGLLWLFASTAMFDCANENLREVVSPDGTLKTVQFRRNCGATTDYSTQVSILSTSEQLPNDGGNILVIGDDMILTVRWIDDRNLNISGGGASKLFLRVTDFHGVHITYD